MPRAGIVRLLRAVFFLPRRDAVTPRDFVDHHEADVVTRCGVLCARIAQPDDEPVVLGRSAARLVTASGAGGSARR